MAAIHTRRQAHYGEKGKALTPAMHDVLRALASGDAPKVIAYNRGSSDRTVEKILSAARGRLGAKNTVHAVALWIQDKELA